MIHLLRHSLMSKNSALKFLLNFSQNRKRQEFMKFRLSRSMRSFNSFTFNPLFWPVVKLPTLKNKLSRTRKFKLEADTTESLQLFLKLTFLASKLLKLAEVVINELKNSISELPIFNFISNL